MAERVLSQRELNRALLSRQLLLERSTLSIPRAVERIGGIQNQYAPNAYIRLWSCLEGFRREHLNRALERRTVVQATLMRATIHIVSRRDYWPFAAAIRISQREWWLRVQKPRPNERHLEATAERVREVTADSARRDKELVEVIGRDWPLVGAWLELVRVPPSGTWEQRRANLFQTAERWVGPEDVSPTTPSTCSSAAISARSGLRREPTSLRGRGCESSSRSGPRAAALRRFRDENGGELLDVPRAPLPDADTPAPVRFLPTWDAILLVHARRTGVLPEPYRPIVFSTKNPPSVPTFLVDGAVAGTWRYERGRSRSRPSRDSTERCCENCATSPSGSRRFTPERTSRAAPPRRDRPSDRRGEARSAPEGHRSARPCRAPRMRT